MKRNTLAAAAAIGLAATSAFAQYGDDVAVSFFEADLNFFTALVAGVLLAIGFQILLTALSASFGVSAIGNIEEKFHDRHNHDSSSDKHSDDSTSTLVKISNGWGIWMLITASISVFLASWLGVTLSLTGSAFNGVIMGLVIWATFLTLLAWLDTRLMSTMIGRGMHAAMQGLKYSGAAVGNTASTLFGSSERKQMEKVIDHSIEKIRMEVADAMDHTKFRKKLDQYVQELRPPEIDYKMARKEMQKLFQDISIRETDHHGDSKPYDREMFIEFAKRHPHVSKEEASKLADIFEEVKSTRSESEEAGDSRGDQAMKVADHLAGKAGVSDAPRVRQQVADYLRSTERAELDPDALKDDLERIIQSPSATREIVMNRISQIDRSTVVAALAQRSDMTQDRAEKVVSYVETALNKIKESTASKTEGMQEQAGVSMHRSSTSDRPENPRPVKSGRKGSTQEEIEARVAKYFNSLQRPELNYRGLKHDLESILHDPGSTPDVLRARLSKFDRETWVTLLSGNPRISHEQAEKIVDSLMDAREGAIHKAEEVQHQVEARVRQMRDAAIHEAENVRKASAAAAWWTFGAAAVSALAAAAGGALAAA